MLVGFFLQRNLHACASVFVIIEMMMQKFIVKRLVLGPNTRLQLNVYL